MILETIRYVIPDAAAADFERAYTEAQSAFRTSPHCLAWELSRGVEEPERYLLRIEWTSIEAHMEGFRKSPEFGPFLALVRPYIEFIEEMKHYRQTDVRS